MRLGRTSLETLLLYNAIELKFKRRITKGGNNQYRRMLCTKDIKFLQSAPSKKVFRFTIPTGALKYDPRSKNLVVAFDLFMQNWRMINCDDVDAISIINTSPDPTKFWKYFYASIYQMSTNAKQSFMNR